MEDSECSGAHLLAERLRGTLSSSQDMVGGGSPLATQSSRISLPSTGWSDSGEVTIVGGTMGGKRGQ